MCGRPRDGPGRRDRLSGQDLAPPAHAGIDPRSGRGAGLLVHRDAVTLARAAHALAYVVGDIDSGAALIDRALLLNPNLSGAWYVSGWIKVFLGEPEAAFDQIARAKSLSSPFDSLGFKMLTVLGYAHFFAGRYEEACESAEKALRARPKYLTAIRGAAASHALAGRLDDAQKYMAQMREVDALLRLSNLKDFIPLRRTEDFSRWSVGLRRAGLPR
jgi:tetratricopeptide (TPR) repeat protein